TTPQDLCRSSFRSLTGFGVSCFGQRDASNYDRVVHGSDDLSWGQCPYRDLSVDIRGSTESPERCVAQLMSETMSNNALQATAECPSDSLCCALPPPCLSFGR